MAQSPETVRIHNISAGMQISMHLLVGLPKAQPRLRRGISLLAITIPPGRYYDIVKELGCTLEDARQLAKSPEVVSHERAKRIMIREFPPSEDQLAAEAKVQALADDAQARTNALSPPDPPGAVPAGVDLEAAGLPADTPKTWRWPLEVAAEELKLYRVVLSGFDSEREIELARELRNLLGSSLVDVKQLLDRGGVVMDALPIGQADELKKKLADLGATVDIEASSPAAETSIDEAQAEPFDFQPEEAASTAAPAEASIREPSTDWTIEQLTKYAEEHDPPIDLGTAKTKTAILKKIRKATSQG